MATQQLSGMPCRPDHPAFRPTAPLPAPAVEALARPELAFAPLPVRKAVVRYRNASATTVELSGVMDYRSLTVPEFNELKLSEEWIAESRATLAEAGMLHLIEVTA